MSAESTAPPCACTPVTVHTPLRLEIRLTWVEAEGAVFQPEAPPAPATPGGGSTMWWGPEGEFEQFLQVVADNRRSRKPP